MRRTPIVLTSTVAGLAAVLSFQQQPRGPLAGLAPPSLSSTPVASERASKSMQTADGIAVPNQYGVVQVRVTMKDGRISAVTPLQLPQGDPKSAQISTVAAPALSRQVIAAQSAQIDGISGASYTSAGYAESLQAAIDQLPAAPGPTA